MDDITYSDISDMSVETSSDSSEEELDLVYSKRVRPKNENYLEETVPRYSNVEFNEHFRISRHIAMDLAERFQGSEYFKIQSGEHGKFSAFEHTAVFLWFAGHQTASFRDVADRFNISISSLWRIIHRMIYFISNNLAEQIIRWPSAEEKVVIERHFRENNFPGVIGVIDGTHVRIDKPKNDPDSYLNRKHYFSIQAQVVCDHRRYIRNIFVGYPGSVHDSRVFRTSLLCDSLQEKCGDYYLLGDSGYPCMRHLLTPFRDRGQLNEAELNYNFKLSKNRYVIEHCFGMLKQKFRQLYHIKLRKIPDIVHFIRACCVLHNLAIDDDFLYEENNRDVQQNEQVRLNVQQGEEQDDRGGVQKRNHVVHLLSNY